MGGLRMRANRYLALGLAAALVWAWPALARDFFLQEGTEIYLRLHTTVDTKMNQTGDRILATVEEAVLIDNMEVIPAGARVLGRVGEIKKPGRFGRGGRLVLAFESIEIPGAGVVQINGSLVDLYTAEYDEDELKDVDIGAEGQVKGGGPGKVKRLGSVLGAGAIGGAAGGGAGGAIGVAVGTGVAAIWFKGKHVEMPAGTGMVMRVDRGITFSVPDLPATGEKEKR